MKQHSRINTPLTTSLAVLAVVGVFCTSSALATDVIVLSDSFSRTTPGPVGTAPSKDTSLAAQALADANWVSSWGANNNAGGGYVTQTYTPYLDGIKQYKADGANGLSGNWLNNGDAAYPLKFNNSATTTTEAIGLPGFAWTQINHNFAADSTVLAASKLRVSFDLYRTPAGNISWFFGNGSATGAGNGNAGSPVLNTANDISLLWRGPGAAGGNIGVKDSGLHPAGYGGTPAQSDSFAYAQGNAVVSALTPPIGVLIEISGTTFGTSSSLIEMWVAGVQQDLNGSNAGLGLGFAWDGGTDAYMGFGSNNTPIEGTLAAPVYRASGIDNLVITAVGVPEPTSAALLGLGALGLVFVRRSRKQA